MVLRDTRVGLGCRLLVAALAIFAGAVRVSAQDAAPEQQPTPRAGPGPLLLDGARVDIPALNGALTLTGYLYRPKEAGDAPRPAVVMMHGCSGLINPKTGRFFALYQPWVRALNAAGYVALVVDSATPRGFGQTCSPPQAAGRMWRERPADAYAALAYLQAQPGVAADRIALSGWSQGGGATLIAINERTFVRASPEGQAAMARFPHDFRAAVAFYPGACSERFQVRTYPEGETQDPRSGGWTAKVPLLVLFGDADTWTELAPCAAFLDAARARGNAIELKVYPGAVHAFDAPALKRTELPQYRTADGRIPILETDPAARKDAFARVLAWLKERLG